MSEQEPATILVVDDSRTIRFALKKVLSKRYNVLEAEDGEAAWESLQANPAVRVVISDIQMPRLDGYGLICRIRGAEQAQIKDLPIIVVTSADDELTRERAHACGADDFIVKPVEFSDLLERANFHTEANLPRAALRAKHEAEFETEIEEAVVAAPDPTTALSILRGEATGALDPFVVELCQQVMPLLEHCNQITNAGLENELAAIKKKLGEL